METEVNFSCKENGKEWFWRASSNTCLMCARLSISYLHNCNLSKITKHSTESWLRIPCVLPYLICETDTDYPTTLFKSHLSSFSATLQLIPFLSVYKYWSCIFEALLTVSLLWKYTCWQIMVVGGNLLISSHAHSNRRWKPDWSTQSCSKKRFIWSFLVKSSLTHTNRYIKALRLTTHQFAPLTNSPQISNRSTSKQLTMITSGACIFVADKFWIWPLYLNPNTTFKEFQRSSKMLYPPV